MALGVLFPLALAACTSGDGTSGSPSASTAPAPAPAPAGASSASGSTDLSAAGAVKVEVHGDWLTAGGGAVWLSGEDSVIRLDPASGKVVATVQVPEGPCEASAFGAGQVWTTTCSEPGLARIDPKRNKMTGRVRLDLPADGSEASIGAGAGSVWVVVDRHGCTACGVARVDPRTLRVTATVPVSENAAAVRFGEGAAWVTNPVDNRVEQIDPRRGRVTRRIGVGLHPRFLAVGEGAVWTLDQLEGTVTRIDPGTGATVTIPTPFAGEGGDIAAGGGSVWVRGGTKLLGRIDPRARRLVGVYGPDSGSGAVTVAAGAVFVSAHDVDTVWRLPLPA